MFNQADKTQALNLLSALKRGKYELQGDEVLAFSQMMNWLGGLVKKIDIDIQQAAIMAATPVEQAPVLVDEPVKPKGKKK